MGRAGHSTTRPTHAVGTATLQVRSVRLQNALNTGADGQRIFHALYGAQGGIDTFWLDRCDCHAHLLTLEVHAAQ